MLGDSFSCPNPVYLLPKTRWETLPFQYCLSYAHYATTVLIFKTLIKTGKNAGEREGTSLERLEAWWHDLFSGLSGDPRTQTLWALPDPSHHYPPRPKLPQLCCLLRGLLTQAIRTFAAFLPASASFCPGQAPCCSHEGGFSTPRKEWRIHVLSKAPSSPPTLNK